MASMTTALVEMANNGNSRTFRTAEHTVAEPRLVLQKVKYAATVQSVAEDSIRVLFGTSDATGAPMSARNSIEVIVRRPVSGQSADMAGALALFREIISSDQFTNVVNSQDWLA